MSILYGLDVKFPHQREIKGGGGGQELAPAREHELRGGVPCPISHIDGPFCQPIPINRDPSPIPDKNTFHPLADVSFQWVAKSSSSSSMIAKKSVIHSTWSHWPSIWLKEWRFHLRTSEVILPLEFEFLSQFRVLLVEIHFLVCFPQQFYWRGDKVGCRGKAQQATLG